MCRYIGRNSRAGVFDFDGHITLAQYEVQDNPPAPGHNIDGIAQEIGKNVGKPVSIEGDSNARR
jgi:D-arabinose 1-dehydrogenase-like Zn-dependent alcohol dehydrogenase